jgi:hypothetical protein
MTTQSRSLRLADRLVAHPCAWPGGYPRYAITDDAQALCDTCCASERQQIALTTGSDSWCVLALAVNWEDNSLRCRHCNKSIPSAYGGDPTFDH